MLEEINRVAREVKVEEDELNADPPAPAAGRVGPDRAARRTGRRCGRRGSPRRAAARGRAASGATRRRRRRSEEMPTVAKKRLGELLLALEGEDAGVDAVALARSDRAGARDAGAGGRPPRRDPASRCAPSPRRTCSQALGHADRDPVQRRPQGRRRRHRSARRRSRSASPSSTALLVRQARGRRRAMVATADPLEMGAFDDLRMQLSLDVQPILVPPQRILEVINDVYGRKADKGGDLGKKERRGGRGQQRGAGRHPRHHRRGADHPLGQLAAVQRGQGARERYPHRAGREGGHRPLPHRRRALRDASAPRASSCRRSSRA